MELTRIQSAEPLEFKYKDVIFKIKSRASEGDRLEVLLSARHEGGKLLISQAEYAKTVIKKFVLGWEGVTHEHKPIAYSFELLEEYFPRDPDGHNVLLLLANFIFDHTDIQKKESELKKG
jgi:hypothetical protein